MNRNDIINEFLRTRMDAKKAPIGLPYAICDDIGIKTKHPDGTSFTPSEAWDAIEGDTGASADSVIKAFSTMGGKTAGVDGMIRMIKSAKASGKKLSSSDIDSFADKHKDASADKKSSTVKKPTAPKKSETLKKAEEKPTEKKEAPKPAEKKPKAEEKKTEEKAKKVEDTLAKEETAEKAEEPTTDKLSKPSEAKNKLDFSTPMGKAVHDAYTKRLETDGKAISAFGEKYYKKDGKLVAENEIDGTIRELDSVDDAANEVYDKVKNLDVGDKVTFENGDYAVCTGHDKFTLVADEGRSAAKVALYMGKSYYAREDGNVTVEKAEDSELDKRAKKVAIGTKVTVGDNTYTKIEENKFLVGGKETAPEYDNTKYASAREVARAVESKFEYIRKDDSVALLDKDGVEHKYTFDGEKFKSEESGRLYPKSRMEQAVLHGYQYRIDRPKLAVPEVDTDSIATLKNYGKELEKCDSKMGLSKDKIDELNKKVSKVMETTVPCMRFHFRDLNGMMNDGFKNQIELYEEGKHKTSGCFDPSGRAKASKNMFGTHEWKKGENGSDFEKYGFIGSEEEGYLGCASGYGDVIAIFKKENVAGRTTYTVGDSLGAAWSNHCTPGKWGDNSTYHGISCDVGYNGASAVRNIERATKAGTFTGFANELCHYSYVEAQYHGKLDFGDVKTLYFTGSLPSASDIAKIKAMGIEIKVPVGSSSDYKHYKTL